VIDGQRVPINRPRIRCRQHDREIPLCSYALFQNASLTKETVWQKVMYGLTMRSYKEVVQPFADAYGLEKSTTSEHLIESSRRKLKELMTRDPPRESGPKVTGNFEPLRSSGALFMGVPVTPET
jgi:hypothetical protein